MTQNVPCDRKKMKQKFPYIKKERKNYVKTHNPKVCNYSCLHLKRCSPSRLCLYILLLDGLPTHSSFPLNNSTLSICIQFMKFTYCNNWFLELLLFENYTNTTFSLTQFVFNSWNHEIIAWWLMIHILKIDIIWKLDKYNFLLN